MNKTSSYKFCQLQYLPLAVIFIWLLLICTGDGDLFFGEIVSDVLSLGPDLFI